MPTRREEVIGMRKRKRLTAILAVSALGAAFALPGVAQGANAPEGCEKIRGTIYCSESDTPSNHWTTDSSKKGSVNSSHPEETTVTNPGGNQPPGKQ
jgi:hypothetical protein